MPNTAAFADPYAERLGAMNALLADPARQSEAKRQRDLALLGLMSGDESLGGVGNALLRESATRQQRDDAERMRLEDRSAAAQAAHAEARLRVQERADAAEEQRRFRAEQNEMQRQLMARLASQNGPLVQVLGPNGVPVYTPRAEAVGQQAPGAAPTEDERKAAGWLNQARTAYTNMQQAVKEDPNASQVPARELVTGSLPGVGQGAAYATMSPGRQKFTTAASSFSEAVLRAATGAGVNRDEALQKVQELTPRYGEHPSVTAMKEQMAGMYLESLQARAGRAAPATAAPPSGRATNFPKALGGGQPQGGTSKPAPVRVTY